MPPESGGIIFSVICIMKPLLISLTCLTLACGNASNHLPNANADSTLPAPTDTGTAAGPQATDSSLVMKDTTQLGGIWFLQPVLVADTATGKVPRLVFNVGSGKFTGNTGCNEMSGTFVFTDSTFTFDPKIITTKMACVGYNEAAFLKNLTRTNQYRLTNGTLILLNNNSELSRWVRKLEPKPVSNKT
jgi:heat shock protein HslJ